MRLSFLIAAHHQPQIFHRLIDKLEPDFNPVIAHIDAKSEMDSFMRSDIKFIKRRVNVRWGGYSQVEMMRRLLTKGLEGKGTHFMFLSGQDYPARPIRKLIEMLEVEPTTIYMACQNMTLPSAQFPNLPFEWYSGDLSTHLPEKVEKLSSKLLSRLPRRKIPHGWTPARGSTSWIVTREVAQHILNVLHSDTELKFWLRTIRIPDEIAFQTIIWNSCYQNNLLGFPIPQGPAAPLHYIDWNVDRENPAILTETDVVQIRESRKMFVRKVSQEYSEKLIDLLDSYN